ncbi:MAG TPA: MFS transporter [Catalimonadaceae bacterium]|nr:MFS transporter [Catalimonadaceae bacterium]
MFGIYKEAFSNINSNIWVLTIATLINRTGSMVVLFTSLYLTKELGFSLADAGILMSFYGGGSVLGSFVGGWLTDRWSQYHIMVGSLITSALVLLLLLLVKSFFLIGGILFAYALFADTFRPAMAASIAFYSTPENRTRSVSLIRLAINLGFSIGPALGGFVALYFGYTWLFIADSITSLGAALMLGFYLPLPNRKNTEEELAGVAKVKSKSAYQDWFYLFFILLVTLYAIGFFQIFASLPQYFDRICHFSEATIGLLMAFNGALVVLVEMPLITWLQNKTVQPFQMISLGVICIPLSFLILLFFPCELGLTVLFILVITLSEIFAMPFMMNYSLARPKKDRQGEYSALYSIAYGIANMIAPSLGLGLADRFGFEVTFLVMVLFFIPVAVIFYYLGSKGRTGIHKN